MYYPYFRGKQYELLTIRENAGLLSASNFVPIIEPVKESLGALKRALAAVRDAGGSAIVIVNPYHGDHAEDGLGISTFLGEEFADDDEIGVGILLRENMTVENAMACYGQHADHQRTFIHAGFTQAKALAEQLGDELPDTQHVFLEPVCGKLYRKHFDGCNRILIRDGFKKRRNKDHPLLEPFSDLHVTYPDEGMNGFGDFLTVGDEYSESGGPAYAVAIHVTFVDPAKDNEMFVYHFVSESQDTPTDPAGKFAEALEAMIDTLDNIHTPVLETNAIQAFRDLHDEGHFPGLGVVKKLSMQHHIETLAAFFE
ncbi:sce7725 family protein [Sphingomonas sp. HITSZ_GF]|uniref:sce7725 family protein n=1 Tax=Sphingomonas sp. HITSZ_GF TaxID=3037247 RepID=UPI00240E0C1C|nr:sce7725 family protein [Sphingomonas sp. HITSZ_GF]MDG2532209.1 sce7725 family protein [Sphingomonas sp. HITSZ_GF]